MWTSPNRRASAVPTSLTSYFFSSSNNVPQKFWPLSGQPFLIFNGSPFQEYEIIEDNSANWCYLTKCRVSNSTWRMTNISGKEWAFTVICSVPFCLTVFVWYRYKVPDHEWSWMLIMSVDFQEPPSCVRTTTSGWDKPNNEWTMSGLGVKSIPCQCRL